MVKLGDTGPELVDIIYERLKEKQEKEEELSFLQTKAKAKSSKAKKGKDKMKKKKIDLRMHEWLGMAQRRKLYRELLEGKNGLPTAEDSSLWSFLHSWSDSSSFASLASADTSFFVGSPLLSASSLMIFIVVLSNRIKNLKYLFFVVFFILNINPIYISFFTFLYILYLIYQSLLRRVTYNKNKNKIKKTSTLSLSEEESSEAIYDYIFIVSNYASLYAANLVLKKNTEDRCLVLLAGDFNEEVELKDAQGCVFSVNTNQGLVDHLITYQHLLDLALLGTEEDSLSSASFAQDRVLLKPLGTPEFGYTHSIVQFSRESPFNYTKKNNQNNIKFINSPEKFDSQEEDLLEKETDLEDGEFQKLSPIKEKIDNMLIPNSAFTCRLGSKSFTNDFSLFLSLPVTFVDELVTRVSKFINPLNDYYLQGRIIKEKQRMNDLLNQTTSSSSTNVTAESPEQILSTSLVDYLKTITSSFSQPSLASLLSIVNCIGGSTTSLPESNSILSLTHLISRVQYGLYSPEHGMSDLKAKLLNKIKERGAVVMENVDLKFEFEELELNKDNLLSQKYRLSGVSVGTKSYHAKKSIVSGLPLLSTLSLLPEDSLSEKTKGILSGLSEDRPLLKVVLMYNKSSSSLKIEHLNYYQVDPYAYLVGEDPSLTHYKEEKLAQSFVKVWNPFQNKDSSTHIFVLEYELSEENILRERLELFKDEFHLNPSVFYDKKNEKTNPKSRDYISSFSSPKVKLSQSDRNLYLNYSTHLIEKLYPQLSRSTLISSEFVSPYVGRQKLKKTSETLKKLQDFSLLSDDINGLVYCHSDLSQNEFVSDIQAGLAVANLILK